MDYQKRKAVMKKLQAENNKSVIRSYRLQKFDQSGTVLKGPEQSATVVNINGKVSNEQVTPPSNDNEQLSDDHIGHGSESERSTTESKTPD